MKVKVIYQLHKRGAQYARKRVHRTYDYTYSWYDNGDSNVVMDGWKNYIHVKQRDMMDKNIVIGLPVVYKISDLYYEGPIDLYND